jgi:ketosteroid isomerase-like protein
MDPTMQRVFVARKLLSPIVLALVLCACGHLPEGRTDKSFNVGELRAAERELESAFSSPDPLAWVKHYTEDAVLVAPGGPPVQGRAALTAMAKSMRPLSAVRFADIKTEGSGSVAAVYGRAYWVAGADSTNSMTFNVRVIIVWRKEADGHWRVAQQLFHPEPPTR